MMSEDNNDTVAVSIEVSAYASQQIGGTIPKEVYLTGSKMDVVMAVLHAEDCWESEWEHDDLNPEQVTIVDEEE